MLCITLLLGSHLEFELKRDYRKLKEKPQDVYTAYTVC